MDTGLGFEQDGELQIHQLIRKAGMDPNSVTKILMSHLHKDHVEGCRQKASRRNQGCIIPTGDLLCSTART